MVALFLCLQQPHYTLFAPRPCLTFLSGRVAFREARDVVFSVHHTAKTAFIGNIPAIGRCMRWSNFQRRTFGNRRPHAAVHSLAPRTSCFPCPLSGDDLMSKRHLTILRVQKFSAALPAMGLNKLSRWQCVKGASQAPASACRRLQIAVPAYYGRQASVLLGAKRGYQEEGDSDFPRSEYDAPILLPDGMTLDDLDQTSAEQAPDWIFAGPGLQGVSYDEAMEMAQDAERYFSQMLGEQSEATLRDIKAAARSPVSPPSAGIVKKEPPKKRDKEEVKRLL